MRKSLVFFFMPIAFASMPKTHTDTKQWARTQKESLITHQKNFSPKELLNIDPLDINVKDLERLSQGADKENPTDGALSGSRVDHEANNFVGKREIHSLKGEAFVQRADQLMGHDKELKTLGASKHSTREERETDEEIKTCQYPDPHAHIQRKCIETRTVDVLIEPEQKETIHLSADISRKTQVACYDLKAQAVTIGRDGAHFYGSTNRPIERIYSLRLINASHSTSVSYQGVCITVPGPTSKENEHERIHVTARLDIHYRPALQENDQLDKMEGCQESEQAVNDGQCGYQSSNVLVGMQTRTVKTYPITRPFWKRENIYRCDYPCKDDCDDLGNNKDCRDLKEVSCKTHDQGKCAVWEKKFKCRYYLPKDGTNRKYTLKHDVFCLDGTCQNSTYKPNTEMAESIAHLGVLKEVQKKAKDIQSIGVFKGLKHKCRRHILHFKDCCGSEKGWGIRIGLSACKGKETQLAEKRDKKLCHLVGTYCSKKLFGLCMTKKTSYCCFESRLALSLQEEARRQVGLSWGSAEHPDCRGLYVHELQRVDFSKLDLKELIEEIKENFEKRSKDKLDTDAMKRNIQNHMDAPSIRYPEGGEK